jgi:uroporphyrinogen-III synthase
MAAMESRPKLEGFAGLGVLSLESRRAPEMAKLIANYGGVPIVAPSMREVPLESNTEALAFGRALVSDGFDMTIFLTGVGTRALARVVETIYPASQFVAALQKTAVVARGPKPVAALKEMGVQVTLAVPEPNTWRDLLRALDENKATLPMQGRRVAVQEYGSSNADLLAGLAERGAKITRVPVYQWALPEDTGPLRKAIEKIARGEADVALFTTSIQVVHLLQVAAEMNLEKDVRRAFARIVVGSIGPVTSEALREHEIEPDFEPSHPKMGILVNEAARGAGEMLARKRDSD